MKASGDYQRRQSALDWNGHRLLIQQGVHPGLSLGDKRRDIAIVPAREGLDLDRTLAKLDPVPPVVEIDGQLSCRSKNLHWVVISVGGSPRVVEVCHFPIPELTDAHSIVGIARLS